VPSTRRGHAQRPLECNETDRHRSVALHRVTRTDSHVGGGAVCVTESAVRSSPRKRPGKRRAPPTLAMHCRRATARQARGGFPAQRVASRSGAYSASRTRESRNRSSAEEFSRTAKPGERGYAAAPSADVKTVAATTERWQRPTFARTGSSASYGVAGVCDGFRCALGKRTRPGIEWVTPDGLSRRSPQAYREAKAEAAPPRRGRGLSTAEHGGAVRRQRCPPRGAAMSNAPLNAPKPTATGALPSTG
jgi:hypothetical protein